MDASKIETIYGLLWLMDIDKATANGRAASHARTIALREIDKEGQARGIEAARKLMDVFPSGFFIENAEKTNAAAAVNLKGRV